MIPVPVAEVWNTIRDFHDMSWASGVIESLERVGDKGGTELGARRILNQAFHETLLSLDDEARTFSYSIDDGPGPVASSAVDNYVGTVRLLPVTDQGATFVEWGSRFESAAEQEVAEFCNPIYSGLLAALKGHLS